MPAAIAISARTSNCHSDARCAGSSALHHIASAASASATQTSSGLSSGRYGSHAGSPVLVRLITTIQTHSATAIGAAPITR